MPVSYPAFFLSIATTATFAADTLRHQIAAPPEPRPVTMGLTVAPAVSVVGFDIANCTNRDEVLSAMAARFTAYTQSPGRQSAYCYVRTTLTITEDGHVVSIPVHAKQRCDQELAGELDTILSGLRCSVQPEQVGKQYGAHVWYQSPNITKRSLTACVNIEEFTETMGDYFGMKADQERRLDNYQCKVSSRLVLDPSGNMMLPIDTTGSECSPQINRAAGYYLGHLKCLNSSGRVLIFNYDFTLNLK